MNNSGLLPNPTLLHLDRVIAHQTAITVLATTMPPHACCPVCQHRSTRVHSCYQRTLADVPWHGVAVRLQLHTRRFFCNNPTCSRAIFTEPLPGVAERYARRTGRLHETFHLIGLMVGGEAGARLAQELGMCSSPDTLLRLLRRAITRAHPTPRILGVDDWAFRKGQHYGTILCDLEQRRVIDLLPERSAASLAQWLRAHPGVEIISRDRSPLYTEGATTGAPTAIQVADRWHLLKNLREALERLLDRRHSSLDRAAREVEQQLMTAVTTAVQQRGDEHLGDGYYQVADGQLLTRSKRLSQQRRDKRQVRYQEAMTLYAQGVPIRTIALRLGMGRHTIRRFVRSGAFPERRAPRSRPSQLDPYKAYLQTRWESGCHNAAQLWQEIQDQGFGGCEGLVRQHVAKFRVNLPVHLRRQRRGEPHVLWPKVPTPSSRSASWLLLYPDKALQHAQRRGGEAAEKEYRLLREQLCEIDPEIEAATAMAQEFIAMVQERRPELLESWLVQAVQSIMPELRRFAAGIRQDFNAILAALSLPWSNGQVEGRVNRLKLVKRQMYGRANFDLLRVRVLAAA